MTWVEDDEPRWWERLPNWVRALFRLSWRLALIFLLILIGVISTYFVIASRYDLDEVVTMAERTILYDHNGRELAAIHGTKRRLVEPNEIPETLVNALTTREDRNFFDHGGVHFRGVARAALHNLKDGEISEGASTLTMQLARNTYDLREDSFHRKFLESAIAYRIESRYSKKEILTAYLNRIYFGSGAQGIGQAAETYFGKEVSQLTAAESALLVGIIRAPHDFSPRNDRNAALRERDDVLTKMRSLGLLSKDNLKRAIDEPLHLMPSQNRDIDASRCVRRHLNELLEKNHFSSGGLTVTSSIDAKLQNLARTGLDKLLADLPDLQCALVAIDPQSGAIRAIVTARDPVSSKFNRAFDSRRQLGPVFQPFLYAFAAERGKAPIPNQPIQTARQLNPDDLIRLAKRQGLTGPFAEGDEFARGDLQATPLEFATSLLSLANEGERYRTYLLENVQDRQGKTFFIQQPKKRLVLDPFAVQALFDVSDKETWHSPNLSQNDFWLAHVSPNLVLTLWLGYDDAKKIVRSEEFTSRAKALAETMSKLTTLTDY